MKRLRKRRREMKRIKGEERRRNFRNDGGRQGRNIYDERKEEKKNEVEETENKWIG